MNEGQIFGFLLGAFLCCSRVAAAQVEVAQWVGQRNRLRPVSTRPRQKFGFAVTWALGICKRRALRIICESRFSLWMNGRKPGDGESGEWPAVESLIPAL